MRKKYGLTGRTSLMAAPHSIDLIHRLKSKEILDPSIVAIYKHNYQLYGQTFTGIAREAGFKRSFMYTMDEPGYDATGEMMKLKRSSAAGTRRRASKAARPSPSRRVKRSKISWSCPSSTGRPRSLLRTGVSCRSRRRGSTGTLLARRPTTGSWPGCASGTEVIPAAIRGLQGIRGRMERLVQEPVRLLPVRLCFPGR